MKVFTYSEARQKLSAVLDEAGESGEVLIRRRDGREFVLRPHAESKSPFDIQGLPLGWTREEIVGIVREGRERERGT